MQTETHIENNTEYWIRFNPSNGRLYQVSKTEPRAQPGFIVAQTTDELCEKICTKKIKMRNCHVFKNVVNEEWAIAENTDEINLDNISHELFKVTERDPTSSEINLRIYPTNSILDIRVNIEVLKANFRVSNIKTIINTDKELFNLYFCKHGDPDYLMGMIEIDPVTLLSHNNLRFDVKFLKQYADWNDIGIFTRKIFNTYSLETSYVNPIITKQINNNRVLQSAIQDEKAHITLTANKHKVMITSNLDESQNYMLEQTKKLQFLVCDGEVDNIQGFFQFDSKLLLKNRNVPILLDFSWPENPIVLYKNKSLAVNYTGV